ncbi:MAG: hypothetical protein EBQ96_08945 [Proteobacteria bacterium]|nr:hypothetical protein [Pseudomonadota bacterium]
MTVLAIRSYFNKQGLFMRFLRAVFGGNAARDSRAQIVSASRLAREYPHLREPAPWDATPSWLQRRSAAALLERADIIDGIERIMLPGGLNLSLKEDENGSRYFRIVERPGAEKDKGLALKAAEELGIKLSTVETQSGATYRAPEREVRDWLQQNFKKDKKIINGTLRSDGKSLDVSDFKISVDVERIHRERPAQVIFSRQ